MFIFPARKHPEKAFTLIEACVTIMISGVVAVILTGIFVYCFGGPLFICDKSISANALSEALDILIDGDGKASGLRFCRELSQLSGDSLTYLSADGNEINISFDAQSGKLYRSINGSQRETIPYYSSQENLKFRPGDGRAVFVSYDDREHPEDDPERITRISVSLAAEKTGSVSGGLFSSSGEYTGERLFSSVTLR